MIFIVGSPRSGTALLRDLLGSHPDIASVQSESKFFCEFYQKYGDLRNVENLNKLCRGFFATEFFKKTGLDYKFIMNGFKVLDRTYKNFFSLIMNQYMSLQRKSIWLEKTPGHILCIKNIVNLYPKAKILLVVRDGRDVSLSLRNIYFDPTKKFIKPLIKSLIVALYWRNWNICGIKDCLELKPEQWRIIRYEKLVLDTDYLRNIMRWLNVRPIDLSRDAGIGVIGKANTSFYDFSGISGTPVGRWVTMMPINEVFAFNILNLDLLRALDYEVTFLKNGTSHIKDMLRQILLNTPDFIKFMKLYRGYIYRCLLTRKMVNSWSLRQFEVNSSLND